MADLVARGLVKKIESKFSSLGTNFIDGSKIVSDMTLDVANGGVYFASGWGVSDFAKVLPSTVYSAYGYNGSAYTAYYKVCYYDENKVFISGYNNGANYANLSTISFTTPANCKYVRVGTASYLNNGVVNRKLMLVLGSTLLDYEDYEVKLPASSVSGLPKKLSQFTDDIGLKVSDWKDKKWVSYGDSITAIGNGDGLALGWQAYVNNYHLFGSFHGRGIGGQSFTWNKKPWFANADGTYSSRDDNGDMSNPASYVLPANTTAHYGAFCSWDRITKMISPSIKDSVNLIFVMGSTNDTYNVAESTNIPFLANNTTDGAWSSSTQYATYNGDYDVTTLRGAIASTIMKMQAWCPNAVLVFGTPLSGRGNTGAIGTSLNGNEYEKAQIIKEVCAKFSIPVIDVFSTSGINPLNRTTYITDTVHPYNDEGKKALARTVISGLKSVVPKIV